MTEVYKNVIYDFCYVNISIGGIAVKHSSRS